MTQGRQIGYIRGSGADRNTDRQLQGVKLDMLFEDRYPDKDRPQLQACLACLQEGDVLHVHSFDRLAWSIENLVSVVQDLNGRGVTIHFHQENMDFGPDNNAKVDSDGINVSSTVLSASNLYA